MAAVLLPPIGERVAKGAALLDEREPGWAGRVDAARVSLLSIYTDVLGQLYGTSWDGLRALGLTGGDSAAYGFDYALGTDTNAHRTILTLAACWRLEVTRRQQQTTAVGGAGGGRG